LYEDGYEQAGFDTRTFNDILVVVEILRGKL